MMAVLATLRRLYADGNHDQLREEIAEIFPELAMNDFFWTDPLEWTVPELMEEVES